MQMLVTYAQVVSMIGIGLRAIVTGYCGLFMSYFAAYEYLNHEDVPKWGLGVDCIEGTL